MNIVKQKLEFLNSTLDYVPKQIKKLYIFGFSILAFREIASPFIIQHLSQKKHKFIIRIKQIKKVISKETGELLSVKDSTKNDFTVSAYGERLRVVISDNQEDIPEPWYLITNDFEAKRVRIIERYYYRFEIEEFFRDAKRLLGLEYIQFKKVSSLTIILWFVMLGIWFLWTLAETKRDKIQREKMQLSRVRYFLEKMKTEIFVATEAQYLSSG